MTNLLILIAMRKLLLALLFLICCVYTYSQNENPFKEFGYDVLVATSSKGEFQEFHDQTDIVEIGSVLYNRHTKEIVKILDKDSTTIDISSATVAMSIDPHCEKYYWISPYAYCLNNPIKFIDPDGKDVYMLFYATSDARFKSAAETRQREIENMKGFDPKKDHVYIQEIGDLGTLGDRVNSMVSDAEKNGYGMTMEASFWSHAGSENGPRSDAMTSGDFATTDGGKNQLKDEGWSRINFNFDKESSIAAFYGCNSASFAANFFDLQPSVAFTAGQGGSAGPSYSTDKFDDVSGWKGFRAFRTSKNVYYGTRSDGNFIGPTVYNRKDRFENDNISKGNAIIIKGKLQNVLY